MQIMNKIKNHKIKILSYIAISVIVFAGMFLLGKIQYGDVVTIVQSNELYTNLEQWEIKSDAEMFQTFTYEGDALNSFMLKYVVTEDIPGAAWEVCLAEADTGMVIQTWQENVLNLGGQNLKEYTLDTPYTGECQTFKIMIKSLIEGTTGAFLYGSPIDSLINGDLSVNGEVQTSDLSVMVSEIRNIKITLVYGALTSLCISAIVCWFIFCNGIKKSIALCKKIAGDIWQQKLKIFGTLLLFGAAFLAAWGMEHVWMAYKGLDYNWIRHIYWFIIECVVITLCLQRKYLKSRPEVVVCTVLAFVGIAYILGVPAEMEVSWDESIHYWRTVALSHANTGIANYAECHLFWHSGIPYTLPNDMETLAKEYNTVQELYNVMRPVGASTDALSSLYILAYIPAGFLLKLARGIDLPYWLVFKAGLLGNLALYLTLVYFSIKKIKSGKMIATVCATVGTAFFLATVYSADWWIFGWFMLAMTYFLSAMQSYEKVKVSDMIIMIVAATIAFFPKAIYFPLLCIFLFLPKGKFRDEIQYQKYLSAVFSSIGLLIIGVVIDSIWILPAWFVLFAVIYPILRWFCRLSMKWRYILVGILAVCLITGGLLVVKYIFPIVFGVGDIRGGSYVNAAQQVQFILENPVRYIEILYRYLTDYYLTFDLSWSGILNTLGYLGSTRCHVISLILLVAVAATDKTSQDQWKGYNRVRWIYLLLCLITVCLVVTALYITFTAVADDSVSGVQQRYLIPMLYGIAALAGSSKIDSNKMNRTVYNLIVIGSCVTILLSNIWVVAISQYL